MMANLLVFWEETWLGTLLVLQNPTLNNLVHRKDVLAASVLKTTPLNIQFRIALIGDNWAAWLHLVRRLMMINLSQTRDIFRWILNTNGVFTVNSMYVDLIDA